MSDFEITPKPLNPYTLIYGVIAILMSGGFGLLVLPKVINFYNEFPNESLGLQMLVVISVVIVMVWVFFIVVLVSSLGKKIVVEGKLVYFKRKSMLGFGKWEVDKIIDFSQISWVRDRQKATYVSTGKGIIPIVFYWLIFEMNSGVTQELLLNGWDIGGVKNLFFFLRGKFPHVKFDTRILRDSSEKLSGIDELLKKS
jgi:hypothetical protein